MAAELFLLTLVIFAAPLAIALAVASARWANARFRFGRERRRLDRGR